jgi:geranylgeranyl reductase family protein
MFTHDIVIVGAGPAGCAAAVELANADAALARRVLLLDKAVFPRPKLCAGALSTDTDAELRALGIEIDVPAVPVHTTQFLLPTGRLTFNQRNQFRVVRRTDFDHALLKAAQMRGIVVHQGEPVIDVVPSPDRVLVRTSEGEYCAKVVIAADGANSKVRARLNLSRTGRLMIAMEIHSAFVEASTHKLEENMAVLDLRILDHGLPGYCWVFPAVNQNFREISIGVMAAPFGSREHPALKTVFSNWLKDFGFDLPDLKIASHPSLRYESKAVCSLHRVLLAGDAAGVDPLFGEGIVSALGCGRIAAKAAFDALRSENFSLSTYERRLRLSAIGSLMRRRRMIARRLYQNPKLARILLRQGTLIRGLALLHVQKYGGHMKWEAGF